MEYTQTYLEFAHQLADATGEIARHYFRQAPSMDFKSAHDPVTKADLAIEAMLRELITKHYPDHGIQGEEYANRAPNSRYSWILDPIDGTRAFACGKPSFTTLIALWEDDKPVLGIIDQPITKERWVGLQGQKTLLNQQICIASPLPLLAQARLNCTTPDMFVTEPSRQLFNLIKDQAGITAYGGDAYAYGLLAAGQIDIIVEADLKFYDVAALIPIIEGAGGIITDWQGNKITPHFNGQCIACANAILWQQVMKILRDSSLGTVFPKSRQ